MKQKFLSSAMVMVLMATGTAFSQSLENFQAPPQQSMPRVWWHWMNGNITKDGIVKDIQWMKKSGIAGFHVFDAGLATPQIVEKRLEYMTPEWKDAFKTAIETGDKLGMEMTIASAPGWSATGGPWVEPKDGMKRLTWKEITVKSDGKKPVKMALPDPFQFIGTFQNAGGGATVTSALSGGNGTVVPYYEDIAVLAYRIPKAEKTLQELNAKVTSSGGEFTVEQLTDGDHQTSALLPYNKEKGYGWIQYEFPEPVTVRAISLNAGRVRGEWETKIPEQYNKLLASDDGVNFRVIAGIPDGGVANLTMTIPTTTAKYFRVQVKNPVADTTYAAFGAPVVEPKGTDIAEFNLYTSSRINHAEEKAGFAATWDLDHYPSPSVSPDETIAKGDVIDITSFVHDGEIDWKAPAGNWKIMRVGFGLTGKMNHPASPEATGLEVDKLDPVAWRKYFDTYFDMYKDAAGGLMGSRGIQYVLTDSYEAGAETWTQAMLQEFKKRRGYDMLPWIPVLTGQIIGSAEESEKFLWDWRKTHSELIAENYDRLTDFAKERGMKGRYSEAHENGRLYLVDGMDVKRTANYPMSAIWCYMGIKQGGSSRPMAEADIKESSSVAHVYGQNIAAAESMTSIGFNNNAWNFYPSNLKQVADTELANGLNLFVIHESAHQPLDNKQPGLGLMIFGQWFNRHETWADKAYVWMNYLGRSSYMLQQGHYVADVLYYYGEDNNITGLFGDFGNPVMPQGYSFDYLNADALTRLVEVNNGNLTTPSGMKYKVLYLDKNVKTMSLTVLRKLAKLAEKGAVICGFQPQQPASLTDDPAEFNALVDQIWNSGRKNVYYTAVDLENVLKTEGITPDFMYDAARIPEMRYVHRTTSDSEIYWVNKHDDQTLSTEVSFRVTGKVPEIWHPDNGQVEKAEYREVNGRTLVTLNLVPDDAVFVVFKDKATDTVLATTRVQTEGGEEIPVEGAWEVQFQEHRGAPEKATFEELKSYTENADKGIKYFSGEATYRKTININKKQFVAHGAYVLDLGQVGIMAEVTVNGQNLGITWKAPYQIDVTPALKAGDNEIEIKVYNPWVNRLIGDQQPDAEQLTYTSLQFYQEDSPLVPSGLMGPVKLIAK